MSDNRYGCKKCGTTWVGGTQPENHCPYCDREVPMKNKNTKSPPPPTRAEDYVPLTAEDIRDWLMENPYGPENPVQGERFDIWFAPYKEALAAVQRVRELAERLKADVPNYGQSLDYDLGRESAAFQIEEILAALDGAK